MSSLIINGTCISGPCQSIELIAKIPYLGWLSIILVGAILVEIAVLISQNKNNTKHG